MRSAVARVLGFGRARVETGRRVAFRSHFGLGAFCCVPGIEGAHEKGGAEGEASRFRRNRLVPVPEAGPEAQLNVMIEVRDAEDDGRRIGSRARTAGQDFAAGQPRLKPLPAGRRAAAAETSTYRRRLIAVARSSPLFPGRPRSG